MWQRNIVFLALCFLGLLSLAAQLRPRPRIDDPEGFTPGLGRREDLREVVSCVNEQFREHWQAGELSPAPPADDLTVARRLALGLTGTVPSLEEIRALQAIAAPDRLAWWLEHLLQDRRYADYVAERLGRAYVGTENGPFLVFRRRRFISWLSDQLYENTPYDRLATTLISDTGLWTDAPAVNFITVTSDQNNDNRPDPARLAARTARAFLGVRLDCVQCHDDNLDGNWLQADFHQLAAFFCEAEPSLLGITDGAQQYEFQYLGESQAQVVSPRVPFDPQPPSEEGPRRQRLARWVTSTQNRAFARTIVNRTWALLFGKPLVEPIDGMSLAGPFPPGLEILAADFVEHGYDLRRLIRVIASTDVFRLESRAEFEIGQAHEDRWAVFPLTRLRPEQVVRALSQAASLTTIDAHSHILIRIARATEQDEFVKRYGDRGEDEFDSRAGTTTQRLLLMNGKLVKERTGDDLLANAATQIAALAPDDSSAVETAYLAVLTRRPTAGEHAYFAAQLRDKTDKQRTRQLEDLYWTLLNCTEFSWNH